jgi:GT2 family glycosyltransferase
VPIDLSIVIPCRRRPDLLTSCLHSINLHAPQATEIVVVDDGSRDDAVTRAAIAAGARAVRLEKSSGFCVAANAGIQASRGSIIEVLNDDTEVTAGWSEAALAHFADPRVAAVAPLVLRGSSLAKNNYRIDSAGDRYFLGGIARKRGHGGIAGPAYARSCRVFGASASSAFYRKRALDEVGAFPASFGAYFEDVDLAFRLHRAGHAIQFAPASVVHHLGSSSYGRPKRRLLEQQSRNEERVFWRNLPAPVLARAILPHVFVLLTKGLLRLAEGSFLPFLFGRMSLLREIPELIHYRRQLHARFPVDKIDGWLLERTALGLLSWPY